MPASSAGRSGGKLCALLIARESVEADFPADGGVVFGGDADGYVGGLWLGHGGAMVAKSSARSVTRSRCSQTRVYFVLQST